MYKLGILGVIRSALTRNLGRRFDDVVDEINAAFGDIFALEGSGDVSSLTAASYENIEWKSIPVYTSLLNIVCRTGNLIFVGLLLSNSDVSPDAKTISPFLSLSSVPFCSLASAISNKQRTFCVHLSRTECAGCLRIYWTLLYPRTMQKNSKFQAFTHALFDLVTYPQYAAPLREEVERVVAQHGWTKAALGQMHTLDSFLLESQRMNELGIRASTVQISSIRHACRFFVVTELKAMLAHVVFNYDVKLDAVDGIRPPDESIASANIHHRTAKFWFHRRGD
ncbi:hypothetical protein DFH08DRAFT_815023 [Mycena albidolilacea]|uniref:Uncharacterized protein n=1 Tax=Mycena albidolilacea TaxID=1033008 RepID=A0AAD6ZP38_9AGAR|nr:hypothetical protein DFH08DRAFT_815023 [Mycena albidolilacea]